ncbi:adipocyte plasma membrane-associated protein-like [Galendromus occidentalis]|uniref:Adipocyte plasma membrane-associated protein-like n=1 Tax=Galendromus occidentalis TaxID=34638 RepID=A0AAJ6QR29_9ACAR|nr:adipocyte plasma membrane-associated protein-like [Galendromus occidentalis]
MAYGKFLSSALKAVLQIPVESQSSFDPQPFNETILLPPDVPITTDELDKKAVKVFEFLNAPESIVKIGNDLYTSAMDGIYKVDCLRKHASYCTHLPYHSAFLAWLRVCAVDTVTGKERKIYDGNADCKEFCSRPLGIRIHKRTMYCADLLKGLIEIDLETEKAKVLLPLGSSVGGLELFFPNDVAVDPERQLIYLSDSDTKRKWDYYMFSLLDFQNNSRIIQFNLTSGEATIFADGLHFANGIQISNDKKSLLVSEFTSRRVMRFPFGGSLPATGSLFSAYLPGNPDNIRPSKKGGYWVALVGSRADGTRTLVEELQARPAVTKRILNWLVTAGTFLESVGVLSGNKALQPTANELKNGNILGSSIPASGAIAELDAEGKVLRVLHSTKFGDLSEILDDDGDLYIGTYLHQGLLKLPATAAHN